MRIVASFVGIALNILFGLIAIPIAQAQHSCDGSEGVYLYEHPAYLGHCVRFTDDAPALELSGLDNTVSSLRLVGDWTATLYVDPAYGGATSTFIQDAASLLGDTVGDNQASSLRVRRGSVAPVPPFTICDGGNGVYLYEHPDYQGRCLKFTDDLSDLGRLGFDNQASSIRLVGDWTATLYRDLNGAGASSIFGQDDAYFFDNRIGDNQATSLRVQRGGLPAANACDGGSGVYLYEHPQYLGRCVKFASDVSDLRAYGFDDTASSVRIAGDWTAILARDLSGAGIVSTFTGDDPNLVDDAVGNNQTTSLRVLRGGLPPAEHFCDGSAGVYLYEHPQYLGRCVKFTSDAPDLRLLVFDDTASSMRVVGDWVVVLYRDLSGSGVSSTFLSDDPSLANDAVGDNQVTSVAVRRQ